MLVTRDTEIEALLGRLTAEIRRSSNDSLVSPGEPFHFKAAGKDWLINWYMVREVGVTLCGPPPRAVVPKISQSEFVEAVREQAEAWKEWVFKVRTPGAHSYAVLTLCRALYTHTHGRQASKKQAALWARTYLPQWAPLIKQSSHWPSESQDKGAGDKAGLQETLRFVHDVACRITGTGESASDASG